MRKFDHYVSVTGSRLVDCFSAWTCGSVMLNRYSNGAITPWPHVNVFAAMAKWDLMHRAAFLAWAEQPIWG